MRDVGINSRIVNNCSVSKQRTAEKKTLVEAKRQKAMADWCLRNDPQRRAEAIERMIEAKVAMALRLMRP